MATKKTVAKSMAKQAPKPARRPRKERKFPALIFEEALKLADAIQNHASGQRVRRLTLFEKLNQSPDSRDSKTLITASGQYGLTKGSYTAEYLELTPEGSDASSDEVAVPKKLLTRFTLAIKNQSPFDFLYNKLKGNKMPAKEVMADYLSEANVEDDEKAECIDTFILNAKFLGLLRTIGGSERIVPIEQAIEEAPSSPARGSDLPAAISTGVAIAATQNSSVENSESAGDLAKTCFYITPIGEDNSEERQHADFMMEYIIKPAVKEFDLKVVRADQMGKPGMIGKQVIEHILKGNAR